MRGQVRVGSPRFFLGIQNGPDVRGTRGRPRRSAGAEPVAAIRSPARPGAGGEGRTRPVAADDLPPDDDAVPHVESASACRASVGPQLLAPKPSLPRPCPVSPQLLPRRPPGDPGRGPDRVPPAGAPDVPTVPPAGRRIAAHHTSGRAPVLVFCPASPGGRFRHRRQPGRHPGRRRIGRVLSSNSIAATARSGPSSISRQPGLKELLGRTLPLGLVVHRRAWRVVRDAGGAGDVGIDELDRLPAILDQLRARYDWILVEGPPWESSPRRLGEGERRVY